MENNKHNLELALEKKWFTAWNQKGSNSIAQYWNKKI